MARLARVAAPRLGTVAPVNEQPQTMTVAQAAEYVGVSRRTMYRWVDDKLVPVLRVRGIVRIPRQALDRWLQANTTRPG